VLRENAAWFTRLRWFVIAAFLLTGLAAIWSPAAMNAIRPASPLIWPWHLALVLAVANVGFEAWVRRLRAGASQRAVEIVLWVQIAVDLGVLTSLVHAVGSTSTAIAFTYLFHIVLACIFFPRNKSLLVALLAAFLYMANVAAETLGILALPHSAHEAPLLLALSTVLVWFVVWYLVSTLSESVRQRDYQITRANEQLRAADAEKNQLMMQTTHDLKSPFSAIENYIQVLRFGHWDALSAEVRSVVEKIEARAQILRERIRDRLMLGELRSSRNGKMERVPVDLQAVVEAVLEDVREVAENRDVRLSTQLVPATVMGQKDGLQILLTNLLTNAVLYSHEGGEVRVETRDGDDGVTVAVQDDGIGIKEDALPRIFDEFYRTNEAARFNELSTGAGLTIVKEIAGRLGLTVTVDSTENVGTTFTVRLARA